MEECWEDFINILYLKNSWGLTELTKAFGKQPRCTVCCGNYPLVNLHNYAKIHHFYNGNTHCNWTIFNGYLILFWHSQRVKDVNRSNRFPNAIPPHRHLLQQCWAAGCQTTARVGVCPAPWRRRHGWVWGSNLGSPNTGSDMTSIRNPWPIETKPV